MLEIECSNDFLNKNIIILFQQIKLISTIKQNNYFSKITIKESAKLLSVQVNNKKLSFTIPLSFSYFQKKIIEEINNVSGNFGKYKYFPYQRVIKNSSNQKIYLSNVQNIILSNLFINQDGVDKYDLYNLIWSYDKDISINKLDTHLTNLKVHLNSGLDNNNINFQSQNKILKLIIN